MFNELTLVQHGERHYIDSREVAALIGKRHSDLLRDIGRYIAYMEKACDMDNSTERKIAFSDFFLKSSYLDTTGRELPCFLLSKMGCEVIAHKLTGEKGVLFTVAYVTKFNAMEEFLRSEREMELLWSPTLSDSNETARIVVDQLRRTGAPTHQIIEFLNKLYEPHGFIVTDEDEYSDIPQTYTAMQLARHYGMYSMYGKPHAQAVNCVLTENIFIPKYHRLKASANYTAGVVGGFRYDDGVKELLGDWLDGHGYPREIYGFDRTYYVLYSDN